MALSTEPSSASPWPLYKRLLKYGWRYRGRLIGGMLAGVLCGGALFGMLNVMSHLLPVMEPNGLNVPLAASTNALVTASVPTTNVVAVNEIKVPGWQKDAEKIAKSLGIPMVTPEGRPTWQFVAVSLIVVPLVVGLWLLAMYLNAYCLRWLGARVVRDLRDEMFETLENQSLRFHGGVDVGRLISRCVGDTSVVESVINSAVADLSRAPFEIIATVAFIVSFAWERHMLDLLMLVVVGFPLCVLPLLILGRRVRAWSFRSMNRISDLVSLMHENLTGIRVVKAYFMESSEAAHFRETDHNYFKTVMRAVRMELLMGPLMVGVAIILGAIFFLICCIKGLRLFEIITIVVAVQQLYKPVKSLSRIVPTIERGAAALGRIFELLDLNMQLPEAPKPVRKHTFDESIVFDDVCFRYADNGDDIVSHISFALPRGGMVAVVGATGSGKTTLANLLARFYDPTTGAVVMDGVDLRQMSIADLRKMVGILTQETVLFNDTVARNIAYGTEGATHEQIVAAAEKANAHSFIMGHPDGYERVVGEKGFVLSGGERQRVAIARIILRNPPILILDEATSALDTVTERQVQEEIALAMQNRTTFAIAHRLSTIRRANLILVMDKGIIIERGTHDELYASNGSYRRLCDIQFSDATADKKQS